MAVEKLREGITKFAADAVTLKEHPAGRRSRRTRLRELQRLGLRH